MTRETFNSSYPFLTNLSDDDLKKLLIFFMMAMLDISLGTKKEDSKIEKFVKDIQKILKD